MIATCELCGKSFETSQKRNLCEACSVAAEQRIYHPTHGVCCICGRTMPGEAKSIAAKNVSA